MGFNVAGPSVLLDIPEVLSVVRRSILSVVSNVNAIKNDMLKILSDCSSKYTGGYTNVPFNLLHIAIEDCDTGP